MKSSLIRILAILIGTWLALELSLAVLGEGLKYAPEPIGSRIGLFMEGARLSLALTLTAGTLGLILGVIVGIAKLQSNRFLQVGASLFVGIMRGTPLLVQIFFVYYALPALIPLLRFNEFTAATLALAANVGAYNAEVIRAGILAIPRGQIEASRSLGLSHYQTLRWVVLPQSLRMMISPLISNLSALLKDSSLASSIGLLELTLAGNRVSSETFQPVPVLTTVALIYLVLLSIFSGIARFWESQSRSSA
jgi:polar amino acid transport system permease protein